ncbi:sulfotransferase family protein [Novosphingobium malaysiense]|uniref:sulfotransferase family protein n=1 Tax=Novosphingobium malaysiense TaxID=1348853 RepID=UPI0018CD7ECD|nr:sulfotransferase [Novosphingobium malaysiense]
MLTQQDARRAATQDDVSSEAAGLRRALKFEVLLDEAFAESGTGRTDFRDRGFLSNLERVLEIPIRLDLSVRGLQGMHANSLRWLVNRIRWEADLEKHPEILEEDVSDPIVVLGLPRSGTTKLQRFLSSDPAVQSTPAWMMWNPAPFPNEERGNPQPRVEWAARMTSIVANTGESYQKMHEFAAHEPDESSFIPLANFDYVMQYTTAPDQVYLDWARTVNRTSPLTYLKRMLQYLQWQQGGKRGPWLLKNPGHTGEMAEMAEVFPRATFVISQRDLASTMGSSFRMMNEILVNTFDDPVPRRYTRETVDYWSYELNRYHMQRAALGNSIRLIEAPYQRCVNDGLGVAREVFAAHGLPWTREGEAAMRQWDIDNPRHKLGTYGYKLEDWGWTAEGIENAFGPVGREWRGR